MSATRLLLQSLDSSRRLMLDAVRDFSAPELAHRAGPRFRGCGQVLGSAAVADREVLRYLGVDPLPTVPAGFLARFARWGIGDDACCAHLAATTLDNCFASFSTNAESLNGSSLMRRERTRPCASMRKVPCKGWLSKSTHR
jgi:hypothetical protein